MFWSLSHGEKNDVFGPTAIQFPGDDDSFEPYNSYNLQRVTLAWN